MFGHHKWPLSSLISQYLRSCRHGGVGLSCKEVVAVVVAVTVLVLVLVAVAVIEPVSIVVVVHVLVAEAVVRSCTCSCRTGIVVGGVGEEQG